MSKSKYLTPDEVCEILRVSRKTLCSYKKNFAVDNKNDAAEKKLVCHRLSYKTVLYERQSVFNFIRARTAGTTLRG